MSANLYYEPVKKGTYFGGGSSFAEMLREWRGEFPFTVDGADLAELRGMALADKHNRDSINKLIDAIDRHGAVSVWAEY